MTPKFFENQFTDIPFRKEVGFNYKGELYKVHVHMNTEGTDTIYKLYFKNNIEDTNKSIMKLVKKVNTDGSAVWVCKPDYFSVMDNEMAAVAGAAIDKVLQERV